MVDGGLLVVCLLTCVSEEGLKERWPSSEPEPGEERLGYEDVE